MIHSSAHVRTERAVQYLLQLSNRERSVSSTSQYRAVLLFPIGKCELVATENCLHLSITANSIYEATQIEDAISERLDGIAAGEKLPYQWIVSPEHPSTVPRMQVCLSTKPGRDLGD